MDTRGEIMLTLFHACHIPSIMTKTYIIHLASSTARKPQVDALCDTLQNAQVVEATDGRVMSESDCARYLRRHLHDPKYPFPLLAGEIGCFLSHRKCWEMIAEGSEAFGLIVEDDVALDMIQFEAALGLAKDHCSTDGFIRFPLADRERPIKVIAQSGASELFTPAQIGLTTAVQLVGRDMAAHLLNLTKTFDRPVDTFLQMNWTTGANVACVYPNGARSVAKEQGGSTIQKKKRLPEKILREWKRWRYRSKIKTLAAQQIQAQ